MPPEVSYGSAPDDPHGAALTVTKGIDTRAIDVEELAADEQEWAGRYERLMRLGTPHD